MQRDGRSPFRIIFFLSIYRKSRNRFDRPSAGRPGTPVGRAKLFNLVQATDETKCHDRGAAEAPGLSRGVLRSASERGGLP